MSDTVAPAESVFRHRAFALYWFSRIASILSFHMLVVAVGWQLYELTGSAFDLGLLGLAQFGPMLVLTVFVGHVADRYDHRIILMLCQIIEACAAAILVYATELVPGRVGVIAGLFFGFSFGMGGLGAALLGQLADATSIAFVYKICSFLPAIGLLTFFLPHERPRGR